MTSNTEKTHKIKVAIKKPDKSMPTIMSKYSISLRYGNVFIAWNTIGDRLHTDKTGKNIIYK